MPYRRKRSPVWWVSYTSASGKRVRCSTGTTDSKEAEALEHKWKLEAFRQQQWDEQPERTFDELMLNFLRETMSQRRTGERRVKVAARQLYQAFPVLTLIGSSQRTSGHTFEKDGPQDSQQVPLTRKWACYPQR